MPAVIVGSPLLPSVMGRSSFHSLSPFGARRHLQTFSSHSYSRRMLQEFALSVTHLHGKCKPLTGRTCTSVNSRMVYGGHLYAYRYMGRELPGSRMCSRGVGA